jgi:hypothetical protein
MSERQSSNEHDEQKKQALAGWLHAESKPDAGRLQSLGGDELPAVVSQDLEDLLWLYADDLLDRQQEQKLTELATREPLAQKRLAQILSVRSHVSRLNPPRDLPRLTSPPPRETESKRPSLRAMPGWSVTLSSQGMRAKRWSGAPVSYRSVAARAEGEPATFFRDEYVLPLGRIEVEFTADESGSCDLVIRVCDPPTGVLPDHMDVEIRATDREWSRSAPLQDGEVEFASLLPGSCQIVFLQGSEELHEFHLEITLDDK